jgi:hypothetical protein
MIRNCRIPQFAGVKLALQDSVREGSLPIPWVPCSDAVLDKVQVGSGSFFLEKGAGFLKIYSYVRLFFTQLLYRRELEISFPVRRLLCPENLMATYSEHTILAAFLWAIPEEYWMGGYTRLVRDLLALPNTDSGSELLKSVCSVILLSKHAVQTDTTETNEISTLTSHVVTALQYGITTPPP